MSKNDHAKKMQTIGLLLLTVLFGGWFYYQSWLASKQQETKQQGARQQKILGQSDLNTVDKKVKINPSDLGQAKLRPHNSSVTKKNQNPIIVETDVYRAEFSLEGAVMRSLVLKQHNNNGLPLEMVRSVDSGLYPFTVFLGNYNDGQPILMPHDFKKIGNLVYQFTTEFTLNNDTEPYILKKTLEFTQDEYMIKVSLRLLRESGGLLAQNKRKVVYSIYYGPQIGPEVDHIGSNRTAADMRSYVYYNGKKSKTVSLGRSSRDKRLDISSIWAGISGKYFGVFGLPSKNLDVYWSGANVSGLGLDATGRPLESSQFLFERRANKLGDDLVDDTFYYYIGPLLASELNIFNESSENAFGLSDVGLNSMVKFSLGFIEEPVKWALNWLYRFIYNYGLAIILFALIVRILLFPLTLKAYKSTSRMRLLQPQMKEIQEKYKGDPKRLQLEMATLYRKEKVNPMGGCLPLLIQMPILIAIANLFYRYFELRGASFIPGWIGDLSAPDLVYSFYLLGWNMPLRLLPIIYLGSQLLSSKLMQASQPPMQNKMQQRMFTLYMPIIFSIVLYNMPSGLILYWTISNVLMMIQQLFMVKFCSDDEASIKHEADAIVAQNNRNYTRHKSKRNRFQKD